MRALPVLLLLIVGLPACGGAPWQCPPGLRKDVDRTEQTARLVGMAPRRLRACWGEVRPSVITEEGVLHVDERLEPVEAAARVAHLMEHAAFEAPPAGDGCLEAWIRHEAEAMAVELEARRETGIERPVVEYPFEEAVRTAPAEDRTDLIEAWLWEHPRGGPGVDGLVEGYRKRCDP
jgi:hypothetical protein